MRCNFYLLRLKSVKQVEKTVECEAEKNAENSAN